MNHSNYLAVGILRNRITNSILNCLLTDSKVYRIKLAERLGLSPTTITNIVDELLKLGILQEIAMKEGGSKKGRGRPLIGLQLVNNSRFAVGVHIGIGYYRVALVNLMAELRQEEVISFDINQGHTEVLDGIASTVKNLIGSSGVDKSTVVGVGVGAAGLVDFSSGVNVLSQNLGWRQVPIRDHLEERLGLPVVVDNVVRTMVLAEWMFGEGRGSRNMALVNGMVGVGAGLIVDGKLLRGSTYGAGELGHFSMLPQIGELCRCGKRGCLETLVSTLVLMSQTEIIVRAHPESQLAQEYQLAKTDSERVACIFAAARRGDPWAGSIVEQSAFHLGVALANLVNLFDPDMILLSGIFYQASDLYLQTARKTMRENAYAGIGDRVQVEVTTFGDRVGVIGSSALALRYCFYQIGEGC